MKYQNVLVIFFLAICSIAFLNNAKIVTNISIISSDYNQYSVSSINHSQRDAAPGSRLPPRKIGTCIFTVSARKNFGFVLNLYDSIMANSPGINCFIWYMSDTSQTKHPLAVSDFAEINDIINTKKNFTMVTMEEMASKLDKFESLKMAFMFDLEELQTAIKPFAFRYTFQEFGARSAMFFDSDIWVTNSLKDIQYKLSNRSAVVTPYVLEEGGKQDHLKILFAGIVNSGFVGLSNTELSANFLLFWCEQVVLYGFVDLKLDMHFDQSWGYAIPTFDHDDYYVIRDNRYNIAHWNLHERGARLHMNDGIPHYEDPVTKKDVPTVFLHFSGLPLFEAYDMHGIRQQTRFNLDDFPRFGAILETYVANLVAHNCIHYRELPYGYGKFDNGEEIKQWMRGLYAVLVFPYSKGMIELDKPKTESIMPFVKWSFQNDEKYENPFASFNDYLLQTTVTSPVDMKGDFYFSSLEDIVWETRADLKKAYPDPKNNDYWAWKEWMVARSPVKDKMMDSQFFDRWASTFMYNMNNHAEIHKVVYNESDLGVNIFGWHTGLFSIGISAKNLYLAAEAAGVPANAIHANIVPDNKFILPSQLGYNLTRDGSLPVNFVIMNSDCTMRFKSYMPVLVRITKYTIGYWAWELDQFPEAYAKNLKDFDEVWCPSSFIKHSIENSPTYDGTVIKVLPIPFDAKEQNDLYHDNLPIALKKTQGKSLRPFVFLVVFDFRSLVERKNPSAAIRAFLEAFPVDQDPDRKYQLIVKSHGSTPVQFEALKNVSGEDPRVLFIDETLSDEENDALKLYADCYVSLHRSEGYGLNILESIGNGIPVIATNYSGNVDFFAAMPKFNGKCSFPIPFSIIKLEKDEGPYKKGNQWADADHNAAVSAMREVAKNDCKNQFGAEMREEVKKNFGSKVVGEKMKSNLYDAGPHIKSKQNNLKNLFGDKAREKENVLTALKKK